MKVGYKTTEFWLALLGQIAAFVLAILGKIDPTLATSVAVGSSAVYGTQRTIIKNGAKGFDREREDD